MTAATELHWYKSSYSSSSDVNDCVEIAATPTNAPATIHVRDSKNAAGPRLTLSPAAWSSFVAPLSTAQ
ncbi:DUF397 domain-containing protein [Streptomyces sp. NPDC050704]|uniref:DUF397 domain-containing protein n=1 Tax=Streptomyces sp. NPDC050704 TaxID=3157219 RepID=UPI0034215748